MGFKDAKRIFLEAIEADKVIHDYRHSSDKNWISRNLLTTEEAVQILSKARGQDAESTPHHFLANTEVWVFKPVHERKRWYVKGYWIGEELHLTELHLISFHPSERSS